MSNRTEGICCEMCVSHGFVLRLDEDDNEIIVCEGSDEICTEFDVDDGSGDFMRKHWQEIRGIVKQDRIRRGLCLPKAYR